MKLLIDNFSMGEVTQPSDTDIPLGAATKAQNVDLFDEGKLKKQKGNLKLEDGPSGVTIKSFIRYEWNLPSPLGRRKTWIVNGTDGSGRDELWWKPYWNPVTEAWVDSWQELTEFEGPYTMDAGTTTTNVRDSQLTQATNDYYNTWLLLNITRQKSMVINDYAVTATQDLTLEAAITGQTTGDKYLIYRFPLIMSLEGTYAADANTNTTSLIDTQLRSDVEDFYAGWKLNNVTRSLEVTITSYDAQNKKLVHPTVASQTSGDTYYVYKEDHDIRVEDVVRFFPRENAIEMSLGNDEAYPLKAPLWFGFISERWFFNKDAFNDTTFKGFWLTRNVIKPPDSSIIIVADAGSGTLADDTYYFKASYLYDGYQESPLSKAVSLNPAGTNDILFDFEIPLYYSDGSRKAGFFDSMLDRRVTHVKLYAAKGDSDDKDDQYFEIFSMPITNIHIRFDGTTQWIAESGGTDGLYEMSGALTFNDNLWANGVIGQFSLSKEAFGKFLRWDLNQGHKSKDIDANYKFRATIGEQHFKSPIFTDLKRDAFVGFSVESNGSGVPVDDVIPLEFILNLSQKDIVDIKGLAEINGFLFVFGENRTFRYNQGRSLFETVEKRGLIASDALRVIDSIAYVPAAGDIYRFDGNKFQELMLGRILDQWQAVTIANKRSAIGGYLEKTHSYWVKAGSTIFIYDIDFNRWRTHSTSFTPVWFADDKDGQLYFATTGAIYELESDSFTEAITFDWRSKVISFVKEVRGRVIPVMANINKLILKHKGDNRVIIEMFDPSYSETYSKEKVKFFPESLKKPVPRDISFEASQIKFHISDEDTGSSQPDHEIDYLEIDWEPVE